MLLTDVEPESHQFERNPFLAPRASLDATNVSPAAQAEAGPVKTWPFAWVDGVLLKRFLFRRSVGWGKRACERRPTESDVHHCEQVDRW